MLIRSYQPQDQSAVLALWQACDLLRPWNNPRLDIARKLAVQPEGFVVGVAAGEIIASAMFGYDGHRGWVNYLGVAPSHQRQGLARQLMQHGEHWLQRLGCPKLNLQVRADNQAVLAFYQRLGYQVDAVQSLGKRLIAD